MVVEDIQSHEVVPNPSIETSQRESVQPDAPVTSQEKPAEEKTDTKSPTDWEFVRTAFKEDMIVSVEIYECNKGGVLVRCDHFQGFVPLSHLMSEHHVNLKSKEFLQNLVEKTISVKVIEMEPERDKLVLSERAAQSVAGCRNTLLERLHINDVVSGVVTNITDFGVFVDLGGLEGLVHISELSWCRVRHPKEVAHLGQSVQAMIVDIDLSKQRIALSIKRLTANPWDQLADNYRVGDVLRAQVTNALPYGAFARIEDGIEGLIHISSIDFPPGKKKVAEVLPVGTSILVKIMRVDIQRCQLALGWVQKE